MFRIGGSAGTGITSGLDRPGYQDPLPAPVGSTRERLLRAIGEQPNNRNLSRFLTTFGLDLLSRPPSGGFFSTVAQSAKGPTEQLYSDLDAERDLQRQVSLAAEQSDIEQEQATELQLLKNLDKDDASAIKKQAQEGFEAGEYGSVNEGIRTLLQIKRFGIEDRPEELRSNKIEDLVVKGLNAPGMSLSDEPVVRKQAVFLTDKGKIEKNNEGISFGVNPFVEQGNTYEPGKVYYSAEQDKFYIYNGPESEQQFELIDIKR
tara:strand:- start:3848 stop:4630 length:783 start_codon:yes stop_codon:yes gene_type:complete